MSIKKLSEINLDEIIKDKKYFKSPVAWEDQVFYFLLVDRFSDGNEIGYINIEGNAVNTGKTPLYNSVDYENAVSNEIEAKAWRDSGDKWVGGNLRGIISKIGYLKRLGITAIWLSPVFKQVAYKETYHGYGIQNFLEIDPHFGSKEDLKELVKVAHDNGIYVIMDIILNHTGDVFCYAPDQNTNHDKNSTNISHPIWSGQKHPVAGFYKADGKGILPFEKINCDDSHGSFPNDDAIWPQEFQDPSYYTCKGHITYWDNNPEYTEGDFFDLKDLYHGSGTIHNYNVAPCLRSLTEVYKYWIAYADIDGFRIDTVKHMDYGATRFFNTNIHEFAQSIGKENFVNIAEITGGRNFAIETLEKTGLDAALGIDDVQDDMEDVAKGITEPSRYFNLFRNSLQVDKDCHTWFRNKVVTQLDDHDKVTKGSNKARFCADIDFKHVNYIVLNALALNALTLGIPCIYYGTEQCFDGKGDREKYIRESMFGGKFGAFRTRDRHFFNEESFVYKELEKILKIRRNNKIFSRGRQYLREISEDGLNFDFPCNINGRMGTLITWSRIFNDKEVALAINTDRENSKEAWVIIDSSLHELGDKFRLIYTSITDGVAFNEVSVENVNVRSIRIKVPALGFVIYEK